MNHNTIIPYKTSGNSCVQKYRCFYFSVIISSLERFALSTYITFPIYTSRLVGFRHNIRYPYWVAILTITPIFAPGASESPNRFTRLSFCKAHTHLYTCSIYVWITFIFVCFSLRHTHNASAETFGLATINYHVTIIVQVSGSLNSITTLSFVSYGTVWFKAS